MPIAPKPQDLLQQLQAFDTFSDIKADALQWMIDTADYQFYDTGQAIFCNGDAVDHMQIIVQGKFIVRVHRNGQSQELGVYETGYITGVLPFSRMTEARAEGIALEPTYVLELHRQHFTEMVNRSYALTQALVARMSDRVRDFASLRFQNEKLMALGKLSAGLAHELNNPASAMVRNAQELYQKVHSTPEKFKAIMTMRITPEQTDQINAILFSKIGAGPGLSLSLMEREARSDDMLDWLEDHDIQGAEDIVETFVDFGMTVEELEQVEAIVGARPLPSILWWLESTLSMERLVEEINEASSRISSLVGSVKNYSHMDRGVALEPVDVHEGIKNTLIMLKHQLKGKQIELVKAFCEDAPAVLGFAGELNQIWTNLIVNAIDAMQPGGRLTIRTYPDRQYVCVEIEDNGSGISEEDQTRIFEPFFTTKPMGEGTGMGLDIVQKIVERHKGSIKLDSQAGRTVFTLCFPSA
ncbi:MAG: ATP-binding protein [Phaeodactylibacter sp.]|uniref:ATP-binding protein n=1 Tax=Phaeodactylibacter sp. TaxID=1940289 RepID=UPI0032ED2728